MQDFSYNKYTRLVLSGGGPRGLAILGALHYIHEKGGLDNIQEYWGTSIGSLISVLLLIGYTPLEAFQQFFMLQNFTDPSTLDIQTILNDSAFCPIEVFGNKVRYFVEQKLGAGADPTFYELHQRFGKKIHILGTNIDDMVGECFNVDTQPMMKVIEAIEISCDLPYIFTKKVYQGKTYVDGGFINNYPVDLADDGKNDCLGICVFGDLKPKTSDYVGWIYRFLYMPILELHRERTSRLSNRFTNIELSINNISMIEMSPQSKKKIEVFSTGYHQAKTQFINLEWEHLQKQKRWGYTMEEAENVGYDSWDWPDTDTTEKTVPDIDWEKILDDK